MSSVNVLEQYVRFILPLEQCGCVAYNTPVKHISSNTHPVFMAIFPGELVRLPA